MLSIPQSILSFLCNYLFQKIRELINSVLEERENEKKMLEILSVELKSNPGKCLFATSSEAYEKYVGYL